MNKPVTFVLPELTSMSLWFDDRKSEVHYMLIKQIQTAEFFDRRCNVDIAIWDFPQMRRITFYELKFTSNNDISKALANNLQLCLPQPPNAQNDHAKWTATWRLEPETCQHPCKSSWPCKPTRIAPYRCGLECGLGDSWHGWTNTCESTVWLYVIFQ